jgi:hypothetical protein
MGSVTFPSSTTANFPAIPSGYILQKAQIQLSGATGGSFTALNASVPLDPPIGFPIWVNKPNNFQLKANGITSELASDNSTGTIPTGTTVDFTVTPADLMFDWIIYDVGTIVAPNIFDSVAPSYVLPVGSAYSLVNTTPGVGANITADDTTFALSSASIIYTFAPASGSASVPGPLPILGAGAALALSRRLRKRIAKTA